FSTTLTAGADYTYYFDAVDGTGLQAVALPVIPTPTAPEDAPDVEDIFIHSILGFVTVSGTGLGEVTMTLSGCASAEADTAPDGRYSFSGLADGDCTITPKLDGYTFTPPGIPVTIAGGDVAGIDFTAELLDSDGDGYSDIDEIAAGSDPLNKDSTPEVCDGADNDLDGQIDEGLLSTYYRDADGDTYGSAAVTIKACSQPSGYVTNRADCNDSKSSINPGAVETDNGMDDNCNGQVDEGITKKATTPDITVSPTTLPYGSVNVDSVSEKTVSVRNDGDAGLTITGITNPSSSYSKVSDSCSGQTLSPSSGCTITIRFSPASSGVLNSSFNIQSNDPDENPVAVSLTGTGASVGSPDIDISSVDISFPNISAGATADQEIIISNMGSSPLAISGSSTPSEPFSIITAEDNCSNHTLAPNQSCAMKVRFTPIGSGTFNSSFNIQSNDPDEDPVTITLGGSVTPGSNNVPTKPNLAKPANGVSSITTTYLLKWEISEDMDGDQITYWLYIGPDPGFAGVDPIIVSNTSNNNSAKAAGYSVGLIGLLGIITFGGLAGDKRRFGMFIMAVIFLGGSILTSCGRAADDYSGSRAESKDYMTYTVTNLKPKTTYYWKVVADDGKGGMTESDDYSFTTL
ncbi:MAG: choice-of-anchor D domain-containing protein, partial [Nitrospirae bacterium]|nr:choice-of-anchor D domain-containing protein [Nitrospirota bacterium]